MKFAVLTDMGRQRKNNEDACFADGNRGYFIVADGMGGHNAGEVASETAISAVRRFFDCNIPQDPPPCDIEKLLVNAVEYANHMVFSRASANESLDGMGTTIVLCFLCGKTAYIAHVGDSRCYKLSDGRLEQLTVDHSYVNELVRTGVISEKEARNHPKRNYITMALGSEPSVKPSVTRIDFAKGDFFLLCTDGLTGMLSDEQIKRILINPVPLSEIAQHLIDAANQQGGQDNITVAVVAL